VRRKLTPPQARYILGLWNEDELREYLIPMGWTEAQVATIVAETRGALYAALEKFGVRTARD
jgi:hypothetical protein